MAREEFGSLEVGNIVGWTKEEGVDLLSTEVSSMSMRCPLWSGSKVPPKKASRCEDEAMNCSQGATFGFFEESEHPSFSEIGYLSGRGNRKCYGVGHG